jgi:hypothetical protein
MIRLRKQGQREAGRLWGRVKADDLDGTFPLGQLELTVTTLQREAARLSSAYLSTFIASELGEPEHPPALSVWDKAFGGGDLREGLRSAVIKTKVAIGEGEDPQRATRNSKAILVSDVGLFIDTAARESLRQGMEMDDRIVGYQRALKGTCGACAGSRTYEAFSPNAPVVQLMYHPSCQCVAEPVVQPKSPREHMQGREATHSTTPGKVRGVDWVPSSPGSGLTKADDAAIRRWVSEMDSFKANEQLRAGSLSKEMTQFVKQLDTAMDHAGAIGKPTRVYRSVYYTPEELGMQPGKVFTDLGFSSTSESIDIAQSAVMRAGNKMSFTMNVSPKVKAIWGANPLEQELLLQRGCRYVVKSVKQGRYRWFVEIDVLPPA